MAASLVSLKNCIKKPVDPIEFLPFLPADNNHNNDQLTTRESVSSDKVLAASMENKNADDYYQSQKVVRKNAEALTILLKTRFILFLGHILHNTSLADFLQSYLAHREKPFSTVITNRGAAELSVLDRKVFMVYYRLFSVEKEHFQIVEDLPKTKVKVVIPGSTNSDINSSNIEEYYLKLLEEIPLLRLPYLWDVVAITGKNNIELTTTFLERVWDLKPMANSELNQSITEISQATSQILKSAAALETNCLAKKSIGNPEKSNKTSNSKIIAMSSTKTEGKELMKQLQFLLSFSVDIVYSLSVVLKAGKNFLPKTAIFVLNGTQLGKPQGTMLIQVILHFYEIILPILMKILGEVFTTTSRNDRESLQKLVDLHKLAVVLGSSCIEAIVDVSINCIRASVVIRSKAVKDDREGLDGKGAPYAEVLNTKLDPVNGLSSSYYKTSDIDVNIAKSAIYVGGLFSDFVKVIGVDQLSELLNYESGSTDPAIISEFLSSLNRNESIVDELNSLANTLASSGGVSSQNRRNGSSSKTSKTFSGTTDSRKLDVEEIVVEIPLAEKINTIQALFPELGEGYIEACLKVYDNKVEDLIEALLTNNLSPKLFMLDRSMKKRESVKKKDTTLDDASYKKLQKQMIREREKQEAYDSYLIDREYNDDYDDQYDDHVAFKTPVRDQQSNRNKEKLNNSNVTIAKGPSKGKTTSSADVDINSVNEGDDYSVDNPDEVGTTEINLTDNKLKKVTRKERKGKKADSEIPPTNWKLQMDETRRVNALLREEEAEIKFWEDIKNTNVKQTKKKNWNAEEEDEDVLEKLSGQKLTTNDISSVPVAGQVPVKSVNKGKGKATQPDSDHLNRGKQDDRASRKQENSNKSEESSQSTDKKKPKTKTFDRHRQKDRSMKKLGQFVPN